LVCCLGPSETQAQFRSAAAPGRRWFLAHSTPYPTKPFEIAIEILSPPDPAQYLFRKCRLYAQWGIQHIVVLDPEDRTAQQWNRARQSLEPISEIAIEGRTPISVSRIWEELDRDLAQAPQA
jgi:Uma2 family endonuclease